MLHSFSGALLVTLGVERRVDAEWHFNTAIESARRQSDRRLAPSATQMPRSISFIITPLEPMSSV